ncbi:MAG: helix-turn-helix domain-containing protein [Kiritimatiellae bacterium]|nr:helix-turn-helix domain-containing protein [Kiritimatiellia bacterium]MBQ6330076.1 helix-turn-helix domain-containing protein [Kiritimatiellia bacterium]
MSKTVKLPYVSRYFPGGLLNLGWLKAVTVNDNRSARRLEWHDHDELEVIFPLKGHYKYEFKSHRPVLLGSENFIVIPGGVMHRLDEAIDPPGARIHIYLKDPTDRSAADGTFTTAEYALLYRTLSRRPLSRLRAPPRLKAALTPLARIIIPDEKDLSEDARMRVRFLCCLVLCECVSGSSGAIGRSDSRIFDEAVKWLERNYSSRVHMDRLIDHIGYSRPMFFELFKRQTNMTPGEFLRNYRLKKAKEMLSHTNMPVLCIGKACGLGAPAHFSRLFKKMTGLTPLAYRRLQW